MRTEGCQPCLVLETSPGRLQAWVRLPAEPVPPAHATSLAKAPARRFQADSASADWHHLGRSPNHVGPSAVLVLSFAAAYALAALCYPEFAAMAPPASSAYTYPYAMPPDASRIDAESFEPPRAPRSRYPVSAVKISIGSGKTTVVFFSVPISTNVWR